MRAMAPGATPPPASARIRRKICGALLLIFMTACWLCEWRRGVQFNLQGSSIDRRLDAPIGFNRPADATKTSDLNQTQLQTRNVFYPVLMAVLLVVLVAASLCAFKKKEGGSLRIELFDCAVCDACPADDEAPLLPGTPDAPSGRSHLASPGSAEDHLKSVGRDLEALSNKRARNRKRTREGPSSISKEEQSQRKKAWSKTEAASSEYQQRKQRWTNVRRYTISFLFVCYALACLGLPRWRKETVSCHKGYFWELHMMFFSLFFVTKCAELFLYTFDPSIEGELELMSFCFKFIPSFCSYSDGYLDSTAIQVAGACGDEYPTAMTLSWTMLFSYTFGVTFVQWVVLGIMSFKDPSQACLAKLVHMDVLASCIQVPDEHQHTWYYTCLSRTFLEDVPQAILQVIYVVTIKPNIIMMCSICFSVIAGLKAMWDRIKDVVILNPAFEHMMRLYDPDLEEPVDDDPQQIKDLLEKYPYLRQKSHSLYPFLQECRQAFREVTKESNETARAKKTDRANDLLDRIDIEMFQEESKIEAAFDLLKPEGQDWLDEQNIKEMFNSLQLPSSDQDVKDMLKLVGDAKGHVGLREFQVYIGRTGGIFKLLELRWKTKLKKNFARPDADTETSGQLSVIGINRDDYKSWRQILPQTEFEVAAGLAACQQIALRHIREISKNNHDKAVPTLKQRFKKLGCDEIQLWMVLAWVRELAPVLIHVRAEKLVRFLEDDDRYRNLFETGTSGGHPVADDRATWEQNLFGAAYVKAEKHERPKYGVLNVLNDERGVEPCAQYGESYLVMKNVRLRCTAAPEDSALLKAEKLAVLDYYAHVLNDYDDRELRETIRAATSEVGEKGEGKVLIDYKELQLHGDILFKRDVEKLVAHDQFRWSLGERLQKACDKHNITLQWMDKEVEKANTDRRRSVEALMSEKKHTKKMT